MCLHWLPVLPKPGTNYKPSFPYKVMTKTKFPMTFRSVDLFRRFFILFFLSLLGWTVFAQAIPPKPSPPKLVNDLTNTLSPTEVAQLEYKLVQYADTTSTQISIVVVPTVGESDMNTYAVALGRAWGIGQSGKNNGILILWSTGERKVYIATGYGAEGALPDAYAKRIIENHIIPQFKQGNYAQGLSDGVDQIIGYLAGEYTAEPEGEEDGMAVIFIFLAILILIIVISRFNRGSGGGGFRGGGGMPYTTYTGWGPSSGNWGGGSGGGGFGGFGGGSFGGGGAGGDY